MARLARPTLSGSWVNPNVVTNAKTLAEGLLSRGISLVTGGTDTHLILMDLTSKNVPGKVAAVALEHAGIFTNYNSVPFDKRKPFDPSGVRIGTPAVTSRGMGPSEMKKIAGWMADVIDALALVGEACVLLGRT